MSRINGIEHKTKSSFHEYVHIIDFKAVYKVTFEKVLVEGNLAHYVTSSLTRQMLQVIYNQHIMHASSVGTLLTTFATT